MHDTRDVHVFLPGNRQACTVAQSSPDLNVTTFQWPAAYTVVFEGLRVCYLSNTTRDTRQTSKSRKLTKDNQAAAVWRKPSKDHETPGYRMGR